MRINHIQFCNFRNCKDLEINFNKNKILIIGKNAQGKTNILEGVYFLSRLKSSRTSNLLELINFGSKNFSIKSDIIKSDTNISLSYSYNQTKQKDIRINSVKSSAKEFKSILKTVLFSSSDLLLLRGTPADRRNWLDNSIVQVYPAYDDRLSKYDRIRIQKNNLLKDKLNNLRDKSSLLDVYNEQLSISGSNIIYLRKKYLKELENVARIKHKYLSDTEELSIEYDNSFLGKNNNLDEISDIQQKFLKALESQKDEEIFRTQSLIGPHRDDIVFNINKQEATKFASQGQQRTVVLAIKLSEIDIITSKTGDSPILLLDDVLAELDDIRQNYLLNAISDNIQTIITSVDTILFEDEFLKDVEIYKIDSGKLSNK